MKSATAIEISSNGKTGPISVTYASQATCGDCKFKAGNGCYAEYGNAAFTTNRLNKSTDNALEVAKKEAEEISKLSGRNILRLHIVGDSPTDETTKIIANAATNYTKKKNMPVFSYTHQWKNVKRASWKNVSILASCDNPEEIKNARRKGYATATVVDKFQSHKAYTSGGIKYIPCPNQTKKVQCIDCKLCMNDKFLKSSKQTIVFEAHGIKKNVLINIINEKSKN